MPCYPLAIGSAVAGSGLVNKLIDCTAETFAWPNASWTNYANRGTFSYATGVPEYVLSATVEQPFLLPGPVIVPTGTTGLRFKIAARPGATCDGTKVAWMLRFMKVSDNTALSAETSVALGYDTLPGSGTAPQVYTVDVTLATLGLAVGDWFWPVILRDADDGTNDTFAGTMGVMGVVIEAY